MAKKHAPKKKQTPVAKASKRMEEKGTKGKYTAHAGGKKHIGKQIQEDLKPGSKASAKTKQEANFARMARRGWKPLPKSSKKKGGKKK